MWSVAPESITQELANGVAETFNPIKDGDLPEYTNEQVPEGFSRVLMRDLNLSISS